MAGSECYERLCLPWLSCVTDLPLPRELQWPSESGHVTWLCNWGITSGLRSVRKSSVAARA
jgi:hypothetical protein